MGLADTPIHGPYVRGKLALAGLDLSTDLRTWLDAVYALWAEAYVHHEHLEHLSAQLVRKSAQLRPEEARKTWGRLPEHRAMAGSLGKGPGLEAGGKAGAAPATDRTKANMARVRDLARGKNLRTPR
jgi:hypothetical protein